jgi:hypothetical protein
MVVCRQHTHLTTSPTLKPTTNLSTSTPYYKPASVSMSSSSNLPLTYMHVLMRDRPAHAITVDPYNPQSRLARHPLTPFLIVPQPPSTSRTGLGYCPRSLPWPRTPNTSSPRRPRPNTDMGQADHFTARTIDSYLLTCHNSTPPHTHCQRLATCSFPAGIDLSLGLVALNLLNRPSPAARKH